MRVSKRFVPDKIAYCVYKKEVIDLTFIPSGYRVKYFDFVDDKYIAIITKDRRLIFKLLLVCCVLLLSLLCFNIIYGTIHVVIPDTMLCDGTLLALNISNKSSYDVTIDIVNGNSVCTLIIPANNSIGTVDVGFILDDIRSVDFYIYTKSHLSFKHHKLVWLEQLNK